VRETRARRSPLEGGGDPRSRRSPLESEPSSEADLARGRRELSSEAYLARGGALLGRSGGPWGPSRCGLCCVRMFCVMFEACLCFVFFAGFKQDPPRLFRGPSWLSPTTGARVKGEFPPCQPSNTA
jgi:hypothetical protein